MRVWILGVALAGVTGGGVAFVLAGKGDHSHCGPCVKANPVESQTDGECTTCKPTPPSDSTDITDVATLLAAADTSRPRVSFEEPPFAPPMKPSMPEQAPMPRTAE